MNQLTILNFNGIEAVDSRQVAQEVEKEHKILLRDIRKYCAYLNGYKIVPVDGAVKIEFPDFFIASTYTDDKGEERPCYLITRKGCDMIANKLTGKKGTEFTAKYINAFYAMEQHIKGQKQTQTVENKSKAIEAKLINARVRMSNQLLKLAKTDTLSKEYKNILVAKSAEVLTGEQLIPLPKSEQKMYSATEIGKMFGVSAQRIGKLSNQYNLKTDEYGEWYHDKSRYSNKEVDSFKYNDNAVEKFRELLN